MTMPDSTPETVSYTYDPEVDKAVVERIQRGMSGFAAEMKEKGIHVGMGNPGVCVTCGGTWPCSHERQGTGDA